MKLLTFIFARIVLSLATMTCYAQVFKPFPEALRIELGAGHNQLKWHINANPPFTLEGDYPRQEFSFTPIARLSYEIYPLDEIRLAPFIGYNQFGGTSSPESTGYKDEIWFHALELGVTAVYPIGDFQMGVGFKYNQHLKMTQRYYGTFFQPGNRSWSETDISWFFKKSSFDAGLRVSWSFSGFIISAESWFGITQLELESFGDPVNVRQNHFRILVGYML